MNPGQESSGERAREPSLGERTEDRLRAHLAGNSEASRRLFFDLDRYVREEVERHRLWPAVRRHLDDVGDVVGPLWEALFRRESLRGFDDRGRGSLRAWLRTCVDVHMRESWRKLSAGRRGEGRLHERFASSSSSTPGVPEPASPDAGQSTMLGFHDWQERCLRALGEEEARVWELRNTAGLDFAALAARLEIGEDAARGRYHRIKHKLVQLGLLADPAADEQAGEADGA